MERRNTILKLAALIAILSALAFIPMVPVGHAYGNTAIWQIGASFNCNNPSFCEVLGGGWGWIEFDSGGIGDATFTDCAHLISDTPPLSGAQGLLIEIENWYIAPGSAGPQSFFVSDGTATIVGHTGGPPVTVPLSAIFPSPDIGIPAVPGHFNAASLFGMTPPPGVAIQIQVVHIPNR